MVQSAEVLFMYYEGPFKQTGLGMFPSRSRDSGRYNKGL